MNWIKRLFEDQTGKPSNMRVKTFGAFIVAMILCVFGLFKPETFRIDLVITLLVYSAGEKISQKTLENKPK
jgi:hypothetical protein